MKKFDVTALGELLIDFTQNGISSQGNPVFEANPGGAPCNVLAMLSKLGDSTAFIGKVGDDFFGRMLKSVIEEIGICSDALLTDDKARTTLAVVGNTDDGERDFTFYRDNTADTRLSEDEVDEKLIAGSRILHFGTLSMTHVSSKKATLKALEAAKRNRVLISFDPNIRPALWNDMADAENAVEIGLSYCDILKIADDELEWFSSTDDVDKGVEMILSKHSGIKLICITLGKDGSIAYHNGEKIYSPAFITDKTVDTTGAGDTFFGCILHYILKFGIDGINKDRLSEMLSFANRAASLITTRKGALRVMPDEKEIML